jgi:beta-glucanase (GH16 family)
VEAVGMLAASTRARARFIIAGRPQMDLEPLRARIRELGLAAAIELRPWRLPDDEMASLFAATDCFLFPYRRVDASGVYFLVKALSRWMIATRVGVFAEDLVEGVQGALIPPEDPAALANAIALAIERQSRPECAQEDAPWTAIGSATREVYLQTRKTTGPRDTSAFRAASFAPAGGCAPTITRRTVVLAAPLAVAVACLPRSVSAQPLAAPSAPVGFTSSSGYGLVKNWDFRTVIRDEATLRAEFYTRYVSNGGTLDHLTGEWSRYRDNSNHEFTPTGLSLVARVVGGMVPGGIESGMLRSRWTGERGVFEIRTKVPRGRGLWPAFWLNPQDQTWPPEIDVFEIVDNGKDTTKHSFHFLHGVGSDNAKEKLSRLDGGHAYNPGVDYSDAFHVFSAEWTAERVRHFVDGALVVDREYRWVHDDGADGGAAHVLVNLAVGGKWPGPPTSETPFPARLDVDYIRVWQRG